MPRVLLLLPTTTYRTHAFMEAARRLGVEVTVGSEEASTMTGLNPAGLLTLDFSNPDRAAEQVAEFAARQPISAVVPVDDQVAAVGAAISRRLGLPSNSVESAVAARNKFRMRELLARAGVPQPNFRLLSFAAEPAELARQVEYPCVVKPLSLAASQGVMRANDEAEFAAAVTRLADIVESTSRNSALRECNVPAAESGEAVLSTQYSVRGIQNSECPTVTTIDSGDVESRDAPGGRSHFLAEHFLPGPEVAVEGLLTQGQLRVLAIFDKPNPLDGPFFEETIYVTPSRLPEAVQQEIATVTADACRALGLVHGPVHAELRLPGFADFKSQISDFRSPLPHVIEVNPRSIGGLCSRVLRFGTGLSLEELIIRHAIDANFAPPEREDLAAGVMMIPIPRAGKLGEIHGIEAARGVAGIEEVTISAHRGQRLVLLPERSLYLGFIFARGPSPESVESALRDAHAALEFQIDS